MTDEELEAKLYPDEHYRTERPIPDMNFIHAELKRKGVTLQLLWQEYLEHYPNGLGYSQFCDYYLKWRGKREISMHQIHKAGEKPMLTGLVRRSIRIPIIWTLMVRRLEESKPRGGWNQQK